MTYKGIIEVDENSLQLPLVPIYAGLHPCLLRHGFQRVLRDGE